MSAPPNIFAAELANLTRRLMQRDGDNEPGRLLLLMGAGPKVGASTMARAIALLAARSAKRGVWLIDLDFWTNGQAEIFQAGSKTFGELGPAKDAVLKGEAFWRLSSQADDRPRRLLTYSRVGQRALFISRFANEGLAPTDDVRILATPAYWSHARTISDLIIVDSPCLTASRAGLALSAQADVTLLVVAPDRASAADAVSARDEIQARGGRAAGVIFNRAVGGGAASRRVA
jgi:Mrp family chromosome partitioning ATPase